MKALLAYTEMSSPDDNPGNNGPIMPTGGDPGHGPDPRKHAVGVLSRVKSKVRLRTLADLLLQVPSDARPEGAKICVYAGQGQNPHPLGEDFVTLRVVGKYFAIDPASAPDIVPHIQEDRTLGIEIAAQPSRVPIKVLSRLRTPAKVKTKRKTKRKVRSKKTRIKIKKRSTRAKRAARSRR